MAKKFPAIAPQFQTAVQTHSQQKELERLRAEIEQLRAERSPSLESELARMRAQLADQTGEVPIDVSLIDPNPDQPRRTLTDSEIQKKVRFLRQQGQTVPIILIPQPNGRYLIFDGEVRWRAAKFKLGWEKIKAVLIPMPSNLHRSALETFLGFEDLNPLDKAEAVFRQVQQDTGLELGQISTNLNTCLRALERAGLIKELGKLVDLSPEEQVSVLTELGVTDELACRLLLSLLHLGLNPASFKTQLLPLLSLPNDLKVAVRQQGLKGSHALMLATLSAKALKTEEQKAASERMAATQTVLSEELNVAQTRELIGQIKLKYAPNTPVESKKMASFLKNLDKLIGQAEFRSASPQQLTQMRQKLTALLESLGS